MFTPGSKTLPTNKEQPQVSLPGDRHARPRSTMAVHAGSLIGSLKEAI